MGTVYVWFWCAAARPLVAQHQVMHMGRRFRNGGGREDGRTLLLLIAAVLVVGVALWLVGRFINYRKGRTIRDAKGLFSELCRAHSITGDRRRLLLQMAASQRLTQPARLFLEPHRFDPSKLPKPLAAQRREIAALRNLLFTADEKKAEAAVGNA